MDFLCAVSGVIGMVGRLAALADQRLDLGGQRAHRARDPLDRGTRALGKILRFPGHHRDTTTRLTGARRLDPGVERQQAGLFGDGFDGRGYGADLRQHGAEGAESPFDPLHRGREQSDVLERLAEPRTGLGDLPAGGRACLLCLAGGVLDIAVARNHRLGRLVQFLELGRLSGHPGREILQVARDVRHRDVERADAGGNVIDQAGSRRVCPCAAAKRRLGQRISGHMGCTPRDGAAQAGRSPISRQYAPRRRRTRIFGRPMSRPDSACSRYGTVPPSPPCAAARDARRPGSIPLSAGGGLAAAGGTIRSPLERGVRILRWPRNAGPHPAEGVAATPCHPRRTARPRTDPVSPGGKRRPMTPHSAQGSAPASRGTGSIRASACSGNCEEAPSAHT